MIRFLRILTCLLFSISATAAFAQNGSIKGTLIDEETNESIVGANVVVKTLNLGAQTDIDGKFQINDVPAGNQILSITFIGYTTIERPVKVVAGQTVDLGSVKFKSEAIGLQEVSVIASVAIDRKTPVAVTTIKGPQIEAKVGNQEFPEMLRSTPSVYVTKQGGGFGDSRINVRGFDQRNTAVMINGIPVNDMENGWVYWSNWAGLSDVTSSMQVQRGLGASKLAVSSVGGSINIVTNAAEMKKGANASLTIGNDGYMKFGAVYSTGLSDKGWAFSFQGTHTRGDGYVDGTMFRAYSYFASAAKRFNDRHSLLFTAIGAPQWHHQRSQANSVLDYELYGTEYNSSWGYLNGEEFSMVKNFYHKPKVFVNHFWTISPNTEINTSAYASFGRGGGTGDLGRINGSNVYSSNFRTADGLIRFDDIKSWNMGGTPSGAAFTPTNTTYPDGPFAGQYVGTSSNGIIRRASMNEHNWYGILSNLTHSFNQNLTLTSGIDLRYYKGLHYRRVEDLMGFSAYRDNTDVNNPVRFISEEGRADGNKIVYNNDGLVNWVGVFAQLEYSLDKLTVFASGSMSNQGFKRIDHFVYTPESVDPPQETGWQNFLGGTLKAGANYNINENHNVFINGGFFSQQPIFDNVFVSNTNQVRDNVENQVVTALELGYGFRNQNIVANVNLYHTQWGNRQISRSYTVDGVEGTVNFTGVAQVHQGIEGDIRYKATEKLTFTGMASLGNWRYTKNFTGDRFDENNVFLDTRTLYTKDSKVPDAAQTTFNIGAEYEIIKNLNFYGSFYHADKLFADFNIASDNSFNEAPSPGEGANQSWELPAYSLLDAGVSYRFKLGGVGLVWRININNLLDETYISESDTNTLYDPTNAVDAANGKIGSTDGSKRNRVFYGLGRTWNTGIKVIF